MVSSALNYTSKRTAFRILRMKPKTNIHTAIVTGATGAIGTALISILLDRGINIIALVRSDSPRITNIPQDDKVTLVNCSLSEIKNLKTGIKADAFFHLGWDGTFGEKRNDLKLQVSNIDFTLDAVDLAKKAGCSVFVGIGSQAEYGRTEETMEPDGKLVPETGYGIGKVAAASFMHARCAQLGIRSCWGRLLSAFGPNDGSETLMNYVIRSLLKNESPALTKCDQIWDLLYSKDVAYAMLAMAENGKDGANYVICSGKNMPLRTYIESAKKVIGSTAELRFGARPYNEKQVMRMTGNNQTLMDDTGWAPKYSFEEAVKDYLLTIK